MSHFVSMLTGSGSYVRRHAGNGALAVAGSARLAWLDYRGLQGCVAGILMLARDMMGKVLMCKVQGKKVYMIGVFRVLRQGMASVLQICAVRILEPAAFGLWLT